MRGPRCPDLHTQREVVVPSTVSFVLSFFVSSLSGAGVNFMTTSMVTVNTRKAMLVYSRRRWCTTIFPEDGEGSVSPEDGDDMFALFV